MLKNYVPLHGHSSYSIDDAIARIPQIIEKTKLINSPGISLTEHGNLMSFLKFYFEAKANNINPIIGVELYINNLFFENNEKFKEQRAIRRKDKKRLRKKEYSNSENTHLIAYAKNEKGLQNILKLSNIGMNNFYLRPLVSDKLVFKHLDENNIVTSACMANSIARYVINEDYRSAILLINKYHKKFRDDFYLEIHLNGIKEQKKVNDFYYEIYKKFKIKPVFALDYHYVNKGDHLQQYHLHLIKQRGNVIDTPLDKWFYTAHDLYIKTIDEIRKQGEIEKIDKKFLEIALENTLEINNKVNIELEFYKNNYPKFIDSQEESKKIFLKTIAKRWKEKIENGLVPNNKIDEYKARLDYELKIILNKGITDYFLIIDDLLTNFVYKTGGATGAGRGSASGSLVLFILNITKVDPIKYGLIFTRFLNPARQDPPDVDCLICNTLIKTKNGCITLRDINIGDYVYDTNNKLQKIINKNIRKIKNNDNIYEIILINEGRIGSIILNSKHKLIDINNKKVSIKNIILLDKIKTYVKNKINHSTIIKILPVNKKLLKDYELIDIQVENSKTFQLYTFKVDEFLTCQSFL
ncbi:MAG: PHP domain-containing protein [Candidatus Cloacimonetes bacterium]|nr:PHP domain-containing protein [Actinomycetota bacterium]MBL7085694.1 PHP domain-containing protein [Candidatus Cloacimonadota bacterium]